MTLPCDLYHVRPASSPCVPLTCRAEASVLFVSLAPSHARAMRVTTVPHSLPGGRPCGTAHTASVLESAQTGRPATSSRVRNRVSRPMPVP
ncbi:MAG: hypothetical protein LBE67_06705 [Kocuria palustris]|nr:hypothetical protein [Kocuria palustris]